MLLLCALVVGNSNVWATDLTTSDFVLPSPQFSENFNSLSATSGKGNTTSATTLTSQTAFDIFDKIYCGKATNTWAIESNTTFDSNVLALSAVSGSPVIASITGKTFGTKGAFSIKVLKTDKSMFGFYAANDGNAYQKANSSVYIQNTAGALSINSGSGWVSIGTYTSDIIELLVVYNNTNSDDTYGDGITLASKKAHVYVNGTCVMTGENPTDFTIPGANLTAFRVLPQASSGNKCTIDDVKIYNSLPPAPAYTITPTVNDADMGSVDLTGVATITATPNDGYRVKSGAAGYTVSSGTATVTNNEDNTFSVVPASDCTITINFEAIPTRTITLGAHDGGTVTIENAGVAVAPGSSVREGTTLTITAAAGVGKKFNSWSVTGATPASTTDLSTTFTVEASNVTIAATFDDATTHPIHWSVNGSLIKTDNVVEDEDISFDAPASGVPVGYKFKGWVIAANIIDGTQSTFSSAKYVTSAKSTAEITYYAVMAVEIPGETDELDRELTGITNGSTTYKSWSGKSDESDAVYAGNSAGSNDAIQLRSSSSDSGIITTASGGNAKKITISWDSNTVAGRTLNVYGKNSAYSAASDLFGDGKGTLLGTIVKGTSTVLEITGDYAFIGLCSDDGAMYLSTVTIEWASNLNYCTTVPTATISLASACTDGEKYYGTYSNSNAFVVPADLIVSEINVSGGVLSITNYDEGDIVPANTGVMVSSSTYGAHTITLAAGGTSVLASDNTLKPSGDAGITASAMTVADTKFYRLTMHNGTKLGFWWGAADGAAFDLTANKAYLAVPTGSGVKEFFTFDFNNDADGIKTLSDSPLNGENIYNLAGQRLQKMQKGINIVNGKKVLF